MNNVRIETLTPVHIGSGVSYEQNRDYLYFDREGMLAVVSPERILSVISGGGQTMPEDISKWVSAIDKRESILPFLLQRKPGLQAADIARRVLKVQGKAPVQDKPMREQLHGGNEQPLIPGSSLKGSLRTALLNRLMKADNGQFVLKAQNLKNRKGQYDASAIEEHYFGKDPNHDAMRLLQVGDVYFDDTICLQTTVINGVRDGWAFKPSISQFVEAIPQGAVSTARLLFNETALHAAERHAVRKRGREAERQPPYKLYGDKKTLVEMLPLEPLFKQTSEHTASLIESEISYWEGEGNPEPLGDYIEHLQTLLKTINSATTNECVLRLGWGTGFMNMTGDWQNWYLDKEDYDDLVDSLRRGQYRDFVYPKTRRLIEGGMPLGYVKLTLQV